MNAEELSILITQSLESKFEDLKKQWNTKHPDFDTRYFICDDLLDESIVREFLKHLPTREELVLKSSIRERKRIGIDIDKYDPIVGAFLMAFQKPNVIEIITKITGIEGMQPDPTLYASGISIMEKDDFLNPHLDNSHDGDQELYRVINLLYYVSPDWKIENGGNLELWDINVQKPTEILSKFNRLVIMETTDTSYHSVNKVKVDDRRICVSNYYFARNAANGHEYRHVTTFTGRPEETVKKVALTLTDKIFLNTVAKIFPSLLKSTKHRRKVEA